MSVPPTLPIEPAPLAPVNDTDPAPTKPIGTVSSPVRGRPRLRGRIGRVLAWAFLIASLVLTLFPFYWMLRTSFSSNAALAANSGNLLPAEFSLGGWKRVLGLATPEEALADGGSGASLDFWLYLRNSIIVATITTVVQTFFCALAAYAFARLRWPGRDAMLFLFLTALMIPPIFTTLPNFILIRDLGLLNTFLGIMLPSLLMAPFSIFFLRQFFLGIPKELEEAARLDGAGYARTFFQVVAPISSAPIMTLAILTYIGTWNEYFWPLLVGRSEEVRVLTVALGVFRSQTPQGSPDWAGLMAATLISALPIIILFALMGKRVINSIGFSGLK
ncbi:MULTISPECIES: carbohydrate ABC transporter permease [unclassified Microbacterium]|uniref:carbohydrate ABC transporter permease n=1 Tax=unclassified Microbacterium TaxID=2609290 RepID=UPI000EA9C9DD|nr:MULTISPECIES: carbohydrate ABC transporter permease [unclassified Microbacterium]MBT2484000.1 carbohydrate ABC transporter permease [Microbacterium sp. ISL-108]RKN66960.1 carbohydrate ABC transporter permease [Microbacterium sp. CGR2]